MSVETISTHVVYDAMHTLPDNKVCGLDLISAEHLKNASLRLAPLLALSFTGFMIHGIAYYKIQCYPSCLIAQVSISLGLNQSIEQACVYMHSVGIGRQYISPFRSCQWC